MKLCNELSHYASAPLPSCQRLFSLPSHQNSSFGMANSRERPVEAGHAVSDRPRLAAPLFPDSNKARCKSLGDKAGSNFGQVPQEFPRVHARRKPVSRAISSQVVAPKPSKNGRTRQRDDQDDAEHTRPAKKQKSKPKDSLPRQAARGQVLQPTDAEKVSTVSSSHNGCIVSHISSRSHRTLPATMHQGFTSWKMDRRRF